MKPKISSGYLTPQAKKTVKSARNRLSESEENEAENAGFDEGLFQALMKCPEKKNLVLRLLASNKEVINKHKSKERRKSEASPLGLLKSKNKPCESPTALFRRRALEQMNGSPTNISCRSDTSKTKSICSNGSSHTSSPVPFEKVLDGVIAYVEIKSRQDEDRSAGAKAVLKSMGAIVRDKFRNDVTHVIFKDGSYSTFQKAKLLKVHLVSILWVEFCRKTMQRQSEKQYPAMRSGFDDETMVCSQMQKEYEDIIREEYRRSIVQGTPLPTTKSLIDRRRTLMTPSFTYVNSTSSNFKTASQEISDHEVAAINGLSDAQTTINNDLIMNDPDCFSDALGPTTVNDEAQPVLKSVENNIECSDMELTHIPTKSVVERDSDMELNISISEKVQQVNSDGIVEETPSRNMSKSLFDRRKTICSSLISSDLSTDSRISSDRSTNDVSLISSEKSTNVSNPDCFVVPKPKSRQPKKLSRSGSSLLVSNESFVFGKNRVKPKQAAEIEKTSSVMSELKLSSEVEKTTSMSSLHVSSESKITNSASLSDLKLTAGSSNKDLSSHALKNNKSVSDENVPSHTVPNSNLIAPENDPKVPKSIQTPEFVTVRKRNGLSSASKSSRSDDSEIISPRKSIRKKVCNNNNNTINNRDVAAADLKKSTPKKLPYDCNNKCPTDPAPLAKKLVVNVEKSPLCDVPNKKTRRRTLAPKPTGKQNQNNPINTSIVSTNDASDNTDPVKPKRKFRKLYNPDDSIGIEVDDEKEREENRNQTRKRKSDEVYINPVEILKATSKTPPKELLASDSDDVATPPKRTRKANKNKDTPVSLNSSADEQKELLNEVLNKKTPEGDKKKSPPRRKSTRIVKPTYKVRCNDPDDMPCTPANRRSTLEFMSHSQLTSSRKRGKKKVDKTKLPTIVCTKLHKPEVQVFAQIARKLGRFNIEDEVSDRTTHLVAGEPKRTINMLRAISRGCWVVKYDWILSSLEEGKWLSEEKYEVTDFSPAVQKCRLERQAFGTNYSMDVFESCPSIYVSLSTNPRCSDLKELITVCKGKVVNVPRMARIVVGQYLEQDDTVCVNETWILDCITFYRRMPFKDKYLIRSRRMSVEV